jgi:hypothetical protein
MQDYSEILNARVGILPARGTVTGATEPREHKAELLQELAQQPPQKCPPLPAGVRLIRYEPKVPPVAIDVCSVVQDVEQFIQIELQELSARLHSPVQIRGGWGVFTILDRLRQVGLELEIDTKGGKKEGDAAERGTPSPGTDSTAK